MAVNGPEPLGDDADPVAVFAAWMRGLHREVKKPSYTEIVRRSRTRYPAATVRQSTTSDTSTPSGSPRWDTVEPIAWASGRRPLMTFLILSLAGLVLGVSGPLLATAVAVLAHDPDRRDGARQVRCLLLARPKLRRSRLRTPPCRRPVDPRPQRLRQNAK